MRRFSPLFLCLGVIAASPASAQFLGPQQGVTPEVAASARAEADALMEAGGVTDLFENVTVGIDPRIRHLRSGLVCSFTPGSEVNKVMVFPGDDLPRGDDVGCNTGMGDVTITHYATRYDQPYTPEFLAEDAGRAIVDRWDTAIPYEGTVATAKEDGLPPTSAARFLIGPEHQGYTQALTARIGDWSFKQRVTSPAEAAMAAQVMTGITWNSVLRLAIENPGHD